MSWRIPVRAASRWTGRLAPEGFVCGRATTSTATSIFCPPRWIPLNWQPDQFLVPGGTTIRCVMHGALFAMESGSLPVRSMPGAGPAAACRCTSRHGFVLLDESVPLRDPNERGSARRALLRLLRQFELGVAVRLAAINGFERTVAIAGRQVEFVLVSSGSTSTEPVQSSGGEAATISSSRHSSKSSSSIVPSKYWSSIVESSRSIATTSKESPPERAYQLPTTGAGLLIVLSSTRPCAWYPVSGCRPARPGVQVAKYAKAPCSTNW